MGVKCSMLGFEPAAHHTARGARVSSGRGGGSARSGVVVRKTGEDVPASAISGARCAARKRRGGGRRRGRSDAFAFVHGIYKTVCYVV